MAVGEIDRSVLFSGSKQALSISTDSGEAREVASDRGEPRLVQLPTTPARLRITLSCDATETTGQMFHRCTSEVVARPNMI